MKMGYEFTIEQTQKPQMTQELIQAIQILQFSNQELIEYVKNELLENPVLEPLKDNMTEEAVDIDELRERLMEINSTARSQGYSENWDSEREEFSFERYVAFEHSLIDHLLSQLQLAGLSEMDSSIGRYIVQCIDDNGYLTSSIEEIADLLHVKREDVERVLGIVQGFDPPGVGARTLEECLLIQLRQRDDGDENVLRIVENHLGDIAGNKISLIAKTVGLSTEETQRIADKIKKLEPKPGRSFSSDSTIKYVVPDIYIDRDGDKFIVRSNDRGVPHLSISPLYNELRNSGQNTDELKKYLNERFNAAIWLIKSIEQRNSTIFKVATAILEHQEAFFRNGSKYLKPLTLKQVGEIVGIHESTVSRSINEKYLQCEQGVFEFKYFFSSGLKADGGEDLSSNSIKEMIREIINGEDAKNPHSDSKIAEILLKDGIDISRRTIAKYREAMGISSSSKRRRY